MRIGAALALALALCGAARAETLSYGAFGEVAVVRSSPTPGRVAIFLSGDGGWNEGVVEMANALAGQDTLVLGVNTPRYLQALARAQQSCNYPAGDFEALSQYAQKKLALPRYVVPVLVGYSSGATLAYATLVQAPVDTFRGAISLGFCDDLPLRRPFCKGHGLASQVSKDGKNVIVSPAPELTLPWIVLHGTIDQVCNVSKTQAFVAGTGQAKLDALDKVGHGFSVEARWRPPLLAGLNEIASRATPAEAPHDEAVSDLPLVEIPASGSASDVLAVVLSGDGGWASIDREVANALARHGLAVVGLDSLQYFWTRRTPEQSATDLARIATHYLADWHKSRVALIGYSRGADVLPFMTARLPPDLRAKVALVALLGPATSVDFEFHLSDWLGGGSSDQALPTKPEVEKLRGLNVVCMYGKEETDSLCPQLPADLAHRDERSGAHHFDGDYEALAQGILAAIPR
ncbi:MAG TPA: AcvB/VirJ family lysyl-phosphatidylglycerol hydrolase [Myxococcota bacterium]|nr:AcvB/VirJ family lysyl-phosphatidylglycerol hydrolase [Myxococcota bacterium]